VSKRELVARHMVTAAMKESRNEVNDFVSCYRLAIGTLSSTFFCVTY